MCVCRSHGVCGLQQPTTCGGELGPGTYNPKANTFGQSRPMSPAAMPAYHQRPLTSSAAFHSAASPPGGRGKPMTAPGRGGGSARASRLRTSTSRGGGGTRSRPATSQLSGRPQTRGELQDMILRYQRQRSMLQTRRVVKRRVDRESEPLIGAADAYSRVRVGGACAGVFEARAVVQWRSRSSRVQQWNHRSSFGAGSLSIDTRGHSIPVSPRFSDVLKARHRAATMPAPGQYHKPSSMLKKPVYKHDPRNDFPSPVRSVSSRRSGGSRHGRTSSSRRAGRSRGSR